MTGWNFTDILDPDVCVPDPLPDSELCPETAPPNEDPCDHVGLECLFPDLTCSCKCYFATADSIWVCQAEEPATECDPTTADPSLACTPEYDCCGYPTTSDPVMYSEGVDFCAAEWSVGDTDYSVECQHLGTVGAICYCTTTAG